MQNESSCANTRYVRTPRVLEQCRRTRNYGQAGAILRYRPDLPEVHSGHNSFWSWGTPPGDTDIVVAVGFTDDRLHEWFDHVEVAGTVTEWPSCGSTPGVNGAFGRCAVAARS